MHIQSVGSQAQIAQTSQRVDTARVDEPETGKAEERDINQGNDGSSGSVAQIKDSSRGTSIDITG